MADEQIEKGRESMEVLLPPAAAVPDDYLNGWCEGQLYLIENYGKKGDADKEAASVNTYLATRPAPKADSALVGELREKAATLLANAVPDADDDDRDLVEYSRACNAILAALSDRDVVLEEAAKEFAYPVGTSVLKPKGYPFPGTVVAAFENLSGDPRYVVESEVAPGMLHIFSGAQLATAALKGGVDE